MPIKFTLLRYALSTLRPPPRLEDVDGALLNTGDKRAEKSKTDEAGGTDSKAFADGGSGVASSVEGISPVANLRGQARHLSKTTGIVGNRTIAINGEGNGKGTEHANSSEADAVHASDGESVADGGGDAEDGDDAAGVAEGKTLDDVGGGTLSAGPVQLEGRLISI